MHVSAANASDSSQAGVVMARAQAAHPEMESFTADEGYKRQAARGAHDLGCDWQGVKKNRASGASPSCRDAGWP